MRTIKLSSLFFAITLFFIGCNSNPPQQLATTDPYLNDAATEAEGDEYWARENFDLQRVGDFMERSDSPEQFESYLNDEDGINNLDLNGDGYVDYISVDEFQDRDSNARGMSLFTRFGPDVIQEIATILLYRDQPNYPGARFLIRGNEQLYGDNSYYETNWLDRAIPLATTLFGNRDQPYRSPYYYDNYPSDYQAYEMVDPSAYRTRIQRLVPQPMFVQATTIPVYLGKVNIKSPHNGKWMDKIHAKLAKPTKEQVEFINTNPGRKHGEKAGKDDKADRKDDKAGRRDDAFRSDDNPKGDRKMEREDKPPKMEKSEKQDDKSKGDKPGKGGGGDKGKGGGKGGGKKG